MTKEITTIPGYMLGGVFILTVAIGFYFWVMGVTHMIKALSGAHKEKKAMVFLHPFGLFQSKYFTDGGNIHRKKSLKYAFKFLVIMACSFLIMKLMFLYG